MEVLAKQEEAIGKLLRGEERAGEGQLQGKRHGEEGRSSEGKKEQARKKVCRCTEL